MKRNFDKILLALLWVMMVSLGITFWMNLRYGFDIFSAAHWEYISTLQANRESLKLGFYISLMAALFLALFGLYVILRPPFRKIPMPNSISPQPQNTPVADEQQTPPTISPSPAASQMPPAGPTSAMRPPSPSSFASSAIRRQPTPQFTPPTARISPQPSMATPATTPRANPLSTEINNIFESIGYIMKPCKKIGKLMNPVVALGYNQTLWIGTSDASGSDMIDAIQTLVAVFDDTLGASAQDIILRGCIISPTESTDNEMVSTFATVDEFKQFMDANKNIEPANFDSELFDAISTYISTVTSYIGKD